MQAEIDPCIVLYLEPIYIMGTVYIVKEGKHLKCAVELRPCQTSIQFLRHGYSSVI